MRKLTTLACIFIYFLFSQFIVKAWVTTDRTAYEGGAFCMDKKLDTYESKRGCWKKHVNANLALFDLFAYEEVTSYLLFANHHTSETYLNHKSFFFSDRKPPPKIVLSTFLGKYVGVQLLLI